MDLQKTDSLSFYLVLLGAVVEIMKQDEKQKNVKLINIRHVHNFSAHAGASSSDAPKNCAYSGAHSFS